MNKIKTVREKLKMSQQTLADKTGLNVATINRIENNHNNPHRTTLKVIALALKVKVTELM